MRRLLYRSITWGDRRHWEVFAGRLQIARWCHGAPCHLPGVAGHRHPVRVTSRRQRY